MSFEPTREFLARHVVHFLEGMALGDWLRLLTQHRGRISLFAWPRVLLQLGVAGFNSISGTLEYRAFANRLARCDVPPPLFILGHFRSGTTHLHNLMSLDARFAFPNVFQTFNPHIFLHHEWWLAPLAQRLLVGRRPQDNVAVRVETPNEDEIALAALTQISPYIGWAFPEARAKTDRFLTLNEATTDELNRWKSGLLLFFRKLTLKHQKPLILKSPPHTARIRLLLELFPQAKFVHIRRDPYAVFQSTRHFWRSIEPFVRLQSWAALGDEQSILNTYRDMYDAFFEQRPLIPAGNFCEVSYEELTRSPVETMQSIYTQLGLGEFDNVRPSLDAYLSQIRTYQPNRHTEISSELKSRIAHAWSRCFHAWDYPC